MFGIIKRKPKNLPESYEIKDPKEIIDIFTKLNLHHQVALLRLISRNILFEIDDKTFIGLEFEYDVDGALIKISNKLDFIPLDQTSDTLWYIPNSYFSVFFIRQNTWRHSFCWIYFRNIKDRHINLWCHVYWLLIF